MPVLPPTSPQVMHELCFIHLACCGCAPVSCDRFSTFILLFCWKGCQSCGNENCLTNCACYALGIYYSCPKRFFFHQQVLRVPVKRNGLNDECWFSTFRILGLSCQYGTGSTHRSSLRHAESSSPRSLLSQRLASRWFQICRLRWPCGWGPTDLARRELSWLRCWGPTDLAQNHQSTSPRSILRYRENPQESTIVNYIVNHSDNCYWIYQSTNSVGVSQITDRINVQSMTVW